MSTLWLRSCFYRLGWEHWLHDLSLFLCFSFFSAFVQHCQWFGCFSLAWFRFLAGLRLMCFVGWEELLWYRYNLRNLTVCDFPQLFLAWCLPFSLGDGNSVARQICFHPWIYRFPIPYLSHSMRILRMLRLFLTVRHPIQFERKAATHIRQSRPTRATTK
jgi:hypothetical protein